MAVHNPIFPGFEWSQAFDLPAGTLAPGDIIRAEFRRTTRDLSPSAVLSTGSGIVVDGDRIFVTLSETQTAAMGGSVKTNFVIVRGDEEIPIGQIITVPVEQLPTRPLP